MSNSGCDERLYSKQEILKGVEPCSEIDPSHRLTIRHPFVHKNVSFKKKITLERLDYVCT